MPELFPFASYWWFYAAFTAGVVLLLAIDLGEHGLDRARRAGNVRGSLRHRRRGRRGRAARRGPARTDGNLNGPCIIHGQPATAEVAACRSRGLYR